MKGPGDPNFLKKNNYFPKFGFDLHTTLQTVIHSHTHSFPRKSSHFFTGKRYSKMYASKVFVFTVPQG